MRVIQIVFNLLSNAAKYSVEDSGCYRKKEYSSYVKNTVYIVPSKDKVQNTLTIDIINNGFSIEPSEKNKIFMWGYRGNRAKKDILGNGM
jgi:signal transduction histidine kinase